MKKNYLLSLLCLGLASMTTQAEVYTFVADGHSTIYGNYNGNGTVTNLPIGFYNRLLTTPDASVAPQKSVTKAFVSDGVMIEEVESPNATGTVVYAGAYRIAKNTVLKVTPAAGTSITGIKARAQVINYGGGAKSTQFCFVNPETFQATAEEFTMTKADTTQTWNGSKAEPFLISPCKSEGNYIIRASWIEFTTAGTSTQTALPVCSAKRPTIAKSEKISFSCPTDGAKIYYTVSYDGSEMMPTTESTLYEGPFSIENDAIVRAIAVKEGMSASFPTYNEFYLLPDGVSEPVTFDFTKITSLKDVDGNDVAFDTYPVGTSGSGNIYLRETDTQEGVVLSCDGILIDANEYAKNCNLYLSGAYGNTVEMRLLKSGSGVTVTAPEGKNIKAFYVEACNLGDEFQFAIVESAGTEKNAELKRSPVTPARLVWSATDGEKVTNLKLKNPGESTYFIDKFHVYLDTPSGINDITVDNNENAPVEYYNLQGVRVENPANGLYIRYQGTKASKVFVK